DDGAVSAAAMALILARGRRRDRFGQCLLLFDDLPPDLAGMLVHVVAAALRARLQGVYGPAEADIALAAAAQAVLAAHDPAKSMEAAVARLIDALIADDKLDALIVPAAHEGELAFLAQAAAARAGVSGSAAIDEYLSGDVQRVMQLLRMAAIPRDLAAGILAALGDLLGLDDPGRAIMLFDRLADHEVSQARAWLAAAPAYRAALSALESDNGD
ncbi:MAG: DUF2336 domain-containing protein, partial [Sphingomicrobium sp.]